MKVRGRPDKFIRSDRDGIYVREYQVGDISTDRFVNITSGSALLGDISAPRVMVSGLIRGCITAREVILDASGQVWGDIYCVSFQLAPKGKLNGWISTYDEGTIDLLMANELTTADLPAANIETMSKNLRKWLQEYSDLGDSNIAVESETRVGIWKQLRMEAASALLARVELETELNVLSDETTLLSDEEPETESQDSLDTSQIVAQGNYSGESNAINNIREEITDNNSADPLAILPDSSAERMEKDGLRRTRVLLETAHREQQDLIREMNRLKSQLLSEKSEVATLKQKNVKLSDRLEEAEYKLVAADHEINRVNHVLKGEQAKSDGRSEIKPQLASEEGDYMLERLESHSRQLAKMRASLVEREIELQFTRRQNLESAQELIRVKRLASVRIKQLEEQLSELQSDDSDKNEYV
jgi:hypothetical protein